MELQENAIKDDQSDDSVVAHLYEKYHHRLKRLIRLRLHPKLNARMDESDILQEAFLEVRRRLPEYMEEPKESVFLWLRTLVGERLHHFHRMHLDAKKRSVYRELDLAIGYQDASALNLASQLAGQFTSVDQNLIRAEVQNKLLKSLQEMETKDREIVAMRHFEELSTLEIADILGLTRSGVLKRHTRAIRRLRNAVVGEKQADA